MGAHPLGQPVPNRADVEVHGLQAPKGALHSRQTLIRADGTLGGKGLPRHTRADLSGKNIQMSLFTEISTSPYPYLFCLLIPPMTDTQGPFTDSWGGDPT